MHCVETSLAEDSGRQSSSDSPDREHQGRNLSSSLRKKKGKSRRQDLENSPSRKRQRVRGSHEGVSARFASSTPFGSEHVLPMSSPNQCPPGYIWIPVPNNHSVPGMYNTFGGFSQEGFIPTRCAVPSSSTPTTEARNFTESEKGEVGIASNSSTVKEDTIKKRVRRASKRDADEEARRRVTAGKKPYTVQVLPSGFVDSGCSGHLKWQEYIRDYTPRMLDMSVIKYDDQNADSREKLWEAFVAKFEFVDHEVTQLSFDKMIKTWLRKERERVKRIHGHKSKGPDNYTDPQWDSLKKYWETTDHREKSEKMSETRKKVAYHPRLGRHGYAGNALKAVSFYFFSFILFHIFSHSIWQCSV